MTDSKKLRLLAWRGDDALEDEISRPTPGDVLYVEPNPDRTRKTCANCFLWRSTNQTCAIHDPSVVVVADMICGYHVYGQPQEADLVLSSLQVVSPSNSGLEHVAGGTSCDNCKHYRPSAQTSGHCVAVADPDDQDVDVLVDALGCCARWREPY